MSKKIFSLQSCVIYGAAFYVGLLYSLVVPTLSIFLSEELGVRPFLIGTFFVTLSLTSIVCSQSIALWSDSLPDRRKLIFVGMFCGCIACLGFSYFRIFSLVLIFGVTFFSLSFSSSAQMLALAREFADQNLPQKKTRLFNSILRACVALGWVVGPPLGFYSFSIFGCKSYYLFVALAYFVAAFCFLLSLPSVSKVNTQELPRSEGHGTKVFIAILAFTLLYACNQSYLISLPLYLSNHLGVEVFYSGWVMGLTAAIEIPIMVFAGWLAIRCELLFLIRIGAFAAAILFSGLWLANDLWQIFLLQIFNAIFIGFVSGLGMSWFQDLLPGQAGSTSSLYLNCINAGSILGSLFIAIFADIYGFRNVFAVNFFAALVALVLLVYLGCTKTQKVLVR